MFDENNFISLQQLREEFKKATKKVIPPSTISHYVQKGLLPKPRRQRLKEQGLGGVQSYFPKEVLGTLLRIDALTSQGWSLPAVKSTIASESVKKNKQKMIKILTAITDTTNHATLAIQEENYDEFLERIKECEERIRSAREIVL